MRIINLLLAVITAAAISSCDADDDLADDVADDAYSSTNISDEGSVAVTFSIASVGEYATRATNIADLCTRIDFAAFADNDSTIINNYTADDEDFGTLSVSLPEGTCEVVIVAHNGSSAATINAPDSIYFADNKVTDTFCYYAEIEASEGATYDITLTRCVAMFRIVVTDDTPTDVSQMEFVYTGGSYALDATRQLGFVQSRQTATHNVESTAYDGQSTYEIYTFPHTTDDELDITVAAIDDSGNEVAERAFDDVPVSTNMITQYTGTFFTETATKHSITFTQSAD